MLNWFGLGEGLHNKVVDNTKYHGMLGSSANSSQEKADGYTQS